MAEQGDAGARSTKPQRSATDILVGHVRKRMGDARHSLGIEARRPMAREEVHQFVENCLAWLAGEVGGVTDEVALVFDAQARRHQEMEKRLELTEVRAATAETRLVAMELQFEAVRKAAKPRPKTSPKGSVRR